MANMLSSKLSFTAAARPKVIETAKGMLLNNFYYDKNILSPIPYEALDKTSSRYILNIHKNLYLRDYSWNEASNTLGIIQDSKNKNRYYFKLQNGYIEGTRQEFLICIEEQNNVIIQLASTNIGDLQLIELVDQDDDFLYFTVKGNKICYLYRYDKKTFAFTAIHTTSAYSYTYPTMHKIYSNDTYIFLLAQLDTSLCVYQYNKISKTLLYGASLAITTNSRYCNNRFNNAIHVRDNCYGAYIFEANNLEQPIKLYSYNTDIIVATNNAATTAHLLEDVTINWNNTDITKVTKLPVNSLHNYYSISIIEINNKKYLNLFVYNQNYENIAHTNAQGIYTFLIESTYELTFKGFTSCDASTQFGGYIESEDKRHIILAKQNAFQMMKFDINIERYVDVNVNITDCVSVGFDELQRIWYERTDTSVHIINLSDAQSVQIKFEKNYYEYSGTTISTYIEFSALNYLNEDMEGTFHLLMTGSAVFTENNTSELTFYYNGTGKQQIAINITGANPITIYPKYVVGE